MELVFFRTTLAALAALLGALLGVSLGIGAARARLNFLLFAAAGVLLAVVVCDVLPEAKAVLTWPAFLLAGGSGWAAFRLFNRYIYPICPSCAFSELDAVAPSEATKPSRAGSLRPTVALLLFALGLHSGLDGVAVVAEGQIAHHTNTALLLAVTFHKLPEGFALALLLLAAGYSIRKTLAWTTLVEATTVLGGLFGLLLVRDAAPAFLGLLLAHVGGGFLFLITGTLQGVFGAPTTTNFSAPPRARLLWLCAATFSLTAGLLFLLRFLAPGAA